MTTTKRDRVDVFKTILSAYSRVFLPHFLFVLCTKSSQEQHIELSKYFMKDLFISRVYLQLVCNLSSFCIALSVLSDALVVLKNRTKQTL